MMRRATSCLGFCTVLVLMLATSGAILASDESEPTVYDAKTAFDALKTLEGAWTGTVSSDGEEARETRIVYRVTAAGSTVVETFAPGSAYEMFSVYHLDRDQLLMTHYCAIGNQPKMKFEASSTPGELVFAFAGGTNFDPATDAHAHQGTIRIVDENTIEAVAIGHSGGMAGPPRMFSMKRESP